MEAGLSVVDIRNRPTAYTRIRDGLESEGDGRERLTIAAFFLVIGGMNPHSGLGRAVVPRRSIVALHDSPVKFAHSQIIHVQTVGGLDGNTASQRYHS